MLKVLFNFSVWNVKRNGKKWLYGFVLAGLCATGEVYAHNHMPTNRVSDIQNTRHNFSALLVPDLPDGATRDVAAKTEADICIFCHTPHASNTTQAPLWNRQLSTANYQVYDSSSMDATVNQPEGSSKLCLSCHDGTIAIGAVNVLNGRFTNGDTVTGNIDMNITQGGTKMPPGAGLSTGFTRNLGVDLSNDHPISFDFDTQLSIDDGDLRDPAQENHIGNRAIGSNPLVPLENGQLQCSGCHDPHIRSIDPDENIKFLRLNRFQKVEPAPANTSFNAANDIICLACHDKAGWVGSAHANPLVGNEVYDPSTAQQFEFPSGTQVWQASCLNCHDTHTVEGSRRLLREGTEESLLAALAVDPNQGGSAAIEQTCYLCHSTGGGALASQGINTEVPDIKSQFELPFHMPILAIDQPAGAEAHDVGTGGLLQSGKDLVEDPALLGKGNPLNRHAECTDCHNPHRVIKNRLFNADPTFPDVAGTHNHDEPHDNIASGVLKGSWGVEPSYIDEAFMSNPISFTVKKGNPPVNGSTNVTQSYVTREYQICFKCHSNYAYDTPPLLDTSGGGTPSGTNGLIRYTNQAMEFQSPDSHKGLAQGQLSSGAGPGYQLNNHRSWHPVVAETGRDKTIRSMAITNTFEFPFDNFVGTQTMYCSDCHGSDTNGATVVPNGGENGSAWGPHGSENEFILKGKWDDTTGTPCDGNNCGLEIRNDQLNDLCFKCHNAMNYAVDNSNFDNGGSGFSGVDGINLHLEHVKRLGRIKCNWCHVAVPHGWKNKGLLVNLNDVGTEAGLIPGTEVDIPLFNGVTQPYVKSPYYNGALLKVINFKPSGSWLESDCGSKLTGQVGMEWMQTSCNNLP